jgi:hypothetical protein|tara:strand:+ start:324 stop:623 length:300 start_codon:yes stop_codon:yes gene_type:complete
MNRYNNIPVFRTPKGRRYYANVKYPEIPFNDSDFYVISQQGDRYDLLAQQYYGDSTLWWIISSANPQIKPNSLYPITGIQLRIPANTSNIISSYKVLNQ